MMGSSSPRLLTIDIVPLCLVLHAYLELAYHIGVEQLFWCIGFAHCFCSSCVDCIWELHISILFPMFVSLLRTFTDAFASQCAVRLCFDSSGPLRETSNSGALYVILFPLHSELAPFQSCHLLSDLPCTISSLSTATSFCRFYLRMNCLVNVNV